MAQLHPIFTAAPETKADKLEYFGDIQPVLHSRDLIAGVLQEGTFAVLYGDSNAGKTFAALDASLCIASGVPWHGHAVIQGPVLYCALEGGAGFRNRVAAWRMQKHRGGEVLFAALPVGLDLLSPRGDVAEVIGAAERMLYELSQPIKMIVVDTLSRAIAGGNENAPDDMGAFVGNVDTIRAATGAVVLVVHHSGKDVTKGARGHSLLRAATDTELELFAGADGTRTVKATKQRDMETGAAFAFRLEVVTVGTNQETGKPVTSAVAIPTEAVVTSPAATAIKAEKLNPETQLLRDHLIRLTFEEGTSVVPKPGAPAVEKAVTRKRLADVLVAEGWLQTEPVPPPQNPPQKSAKPERKRGAEKQSVSSPESEQKKGEFPVVSVQVSVTETIPKREQTRLWKRLDMLKSLGKIDFNKQHIWMIFS
jgi:hypothetical protein